MKQTPEYTESLQQSQTSVRGEREVGSLRRQIRNLQQQVSTHQAEIQQVNNQKRRENEQLRVERDNVSTQNRQLQQQLQAKTTSLREKDRDLQEKVRELQEKAGALQTSEQLVAQFQQTLEEKDRAIRDLQTSASDRERQQLRQQERVRPPPSSEKMTVSAVDIGKLRWEDGKKAPERMGRGSAVVDGNTVYINPWRSLNMYSCQVISSQQQQWSTLPDQQYYYSSLVVIDGMLTSVGGIRGDKCTNSLLSLTRSGRGRRWSEVFPAMPTPRSQTVSLTTQHALIVAGGCTRNKNVDIVEVMDIPTRQWSTASHLPHPFGLASGTICGDKLYLAGGCVGVGEPTKSVVTCSVSDLLSPPSLGASSLSLANKTGVWQRAGDLPVTESTIVTLGGHLLAVGGVDDSRRDTDAVHCYDNHTDSWRVVSEMKEPRYRCLAAVLPGDQLLVVGGNVHLGATSEGLFITCDTVEIASLH